ncbi:prolyl-tRNA synthetase associated domain-containing protein [Streptococcus oricebi]|uniref:Prolyl-tRNA editing protein n=1 Tax=Streptococcus oricebi TaxID=1547447 RepID=A0ABS5B4D1_9STRE|nr:prolyl-tRNA synthetase associated domain-containing protein [Streptococcus oricebi]MBP2623669.1 prolyl-tRNA editing protein [Streptococcus oricebi]
MTNEEWIYAKLDEMGIVYERLDHEPIMSVIEAAEKGIVLPGCQVKNLFLRNKKGRRFYLVILPDEKIADLKQLAELLGEKGLSFASDERLEELLEVKPGAVTPFGLAFDRDKKVQVIIDETVPLDAQVGFHPFVNTTTLNIAYSDLLRFLDWTGHEVRRLNC